ncbi:MAG: NAD(P)/FAD-dependent oxidoreductase [bacterium]
MVIGGGPPGENAAQYAIEGSDRTAVIVESELLGGECSFWACMPSKAMLRPVELLRAAATVPGIEQFASGRIDAAAVLARRDKIIANRDDTSQVDWATSVSIDVIRGQGRLDGPRRVVVESADGSQRVITARQAVVLATGTTASVPPVPGLREARPWISRDATNVEEIPDRVIVIGGGVVACEASTWLSGLGSQVTIIERGERLLGMDEPFAGELVADAFAKHGVTVRSAAHLSSVSRPDARDTGYGRPHGGPVEVEVDGETLVADEILVAAGRTPTSSMIGLDTVGLADSAGHYVDVDDHLTVTGVDDAEPWLYAVGDLNGRALLTHMGKYQARICGAVIAARAEGRPLDGPDYTDVADHDRVPQVTFTDPQVASVGLTESKAREAGIDVATVEHDLAALAGSSVTSDDYVGRAKLVIDRAAGVVVGATFVGPEIGELLHSATVAVVGRVPLSTLWHAVPSYPTVSEAWLRLLEGYRRQQ